jgi:hypothetical protein
VIPSQRAAKHYPFVEELCLIRLVHSAISLDRINVRPHIGGSCGPGITVVRSRPPPIARLSATGKIGGSDECLNLDRNTGDQVA